MKTKLFFAAILISLTGYAFASNDSSEITSDMRSINNFSGVIVNTPANVILSQGEENSVRIEGEKKMVNEITTRIENGSLVISGENSHAVTIYITVQEISLLEINGEAKVYANGPISSDVLLLKVNGSGSIRMDVRTLTVGMIVKGNGKIIVSGSTGDSFARVNGNGTIYADNLDSRKVANVPEHVQAERTIPVVQ